MSVSLNDILNKEPIEPKKLMMENQKTPVSTKLQSISPKVPKLEALSMFATRNLFEQKDNKKEPLLSLVMKAKKDEKKNSRFLHILSERKKRRQMNYLFKEIQKSLGIDSKTKVTMVDTLVMAIERISEGKTKINLDEIDFDIEKKGDERFLTE